MSSEPAPPVEVVAPVLLAAAAAESAAQSDAVLTDAHSSQQSSSRFPLAEGESPIGRLYKDAVQRVFSFLTPAELAITHSVSQLWRAAHDSERQARWLVTQILPRTIKRLQAELVSADESTQLHAVAEIRILLSRPKDPPITEVIATPGLLPRLVEILQSPVAQLQLTNIASGTSKDCMMETGVVPILVRMLGNTNAEFADATEQAVWCIGNIAGGVARSRDFVLRHGALQPLLALVQPNARLSLIRNTTWTLSNLMRGKPQTEYEVMLAALPTLRALLEMTDEETQTDAGWALSFISDDSGSAEPRIRSVLESGVVPRLVERLSADNVNVVVPCLRTLGKLARQITRAHQKTHEPSALLCWFVFVLTRSDYASPCAGGSRSDAGTQVVLAAGFLAQLDRLLTHPKKDLRKYSAWELASVLAGPPAQIQAVLDAKLMQVLIERLKGAETEYDVKKECTRCVTNLTSGGTFEQVRFVASIGGVTALCTMLDAPEAKVLLVALEGLRNFLQVGQLSAVDGAQNPYVSGIELCGGLAQLETLQQNASQDVYDLCGVILESCFVSDK